MEDAITGFLQTESNPDERFGRIMRAFNEIAHL